MRSRPSPSSTARRSMAAASRWRRRRPPAGVGAGVSAAAASAGRAAAAVVAAAAAARTAGRRPRSFPAGRAGGPRPPRSGPLGARAMTWAAGVGAALERLRAAPYLVLVLDYDGTLVEFAPTPEQAAPDPAVL